MKFRIEHIIILVLLAVITGVIAIPKINLGSFSGIGGDLTDVDKAIDFAVTKKWAGSAYGASTNGLELWIQSGGTWIKQETLNIASDGTANTGFTYKSGTPLQIAIYDSGTSEYRQWVDITVPQMNRADAESATYNVIPIESYTKTTITDGLKDSGSNSISDAGTYNFTAVSDPAIFTYSFTVSTDNTGYISSYDPVYEHGWYAVVYCKFSGTNYETLTHYGWDHIYELGSATWCAERIPDDAITKWKSGNEYKLKGLYDFVYQVNKGSYSGTTVTMQLYLYILTDVDYHRTHGGSFGANAVQLAEQTVTLQT